jgi:hypothetical protein
MCVRGCTGIPSPMLRMIMQAHQAFESAYNGIFLCLLACLHLCDIEERHDVWLRGLGYTDLLDCSDGCITATTPCRYTHNTPNSR